MKSPATDRWDRETLRVTQLVICISFFAFLYYFRHGDLLLYGDAVAHTNIARRVFDSRTAGLLQLGTVWLPLPHLLIIPFIISNSMWQSGVGASIPSLIAYIFGTAGIFRLVRGALSAHSSPTVPARVAAWFAAGIYAANPNLLYMQTTAMTEPLYLALFIWALVHFAEFIRETPLPGPSKSAPASSSLMRSGLCVAGACFTRYDGWFLAAALCVAALAISLPSPEWKILRGSVAKFILVSAAIPVLWIAYNAIVYRNPLEFSNGPYSAKGIELKTAGAGSPPHPGAHHLIEAADFFLKSGELNLAVGNWGRFWILALLLGIGTATISDRRLWPLLLLLGIPLPFYMLSIAYGGVPIFIPTWWPFTRYNVRYGLEVLPAFAVFTALGAYRIASYFRETRSKAVVATAFAVLVVASYAFIWRDPVCYQEARINSRTRIALEAELASNLKKLPRDASVLMYLGDHVGALQRAGIPLRRTINEGNHRTWKQPSDPDGLWERTLQNPSHYVDYVIASQGDEVSLQVQKDQLTSIAVIHVSGQPPVTLYWAHPTPAAAPR
jgi:hypothetical protein